MAYIGEEIDDETRAWMLKRDGERERETGGVPVPFFLFDTVLNYRE